MGKFFGIVVVLLSLVVAFTYKNRVIEMDKQIPVEIMAKFSDGMKVTEDGIKYRIVRRGTGRTPQILDKVTISYRGFFMDGRVFDSSYKMNKPAIFQVNDVIPGWTKVLTSMKEGGFWEVIIPAKLAYGSAGAGNLIPPDADLCFQIEFFKIY